MSIEEAREALDKLTWNATCDEDEQAVLLEAADAYGAARELKGHVDACGATNSEKAPCGTAWRGMVWLCDVAKEIEERR